MAFAPTRRTNPKAKPVQPRLPVGILATTGIIPSSSTISATAVIFAPPVLADPTPQLAAAPVATSQDGWSKKVKPPSMVLDDDINGFRGTKGGGRAGGGKRGKGKKVRMGFRTRQSYYINCNWSSYRQNKRNLHGIQMKCTTLPGLMITENTKRTRKGCGARNRRGVGRRNRGSVQEGIV